MNIITVPVIIIPTIIIMQYGIRPPPSAPC